MCSTVPAHFMPPHARENVHLPVRVFGGNKSKDGDNALTLDMKRLNIQTNDPQFAIPLVDFFSIAEYNLLMEQFWTEYTKGIRRIVKDGMGMDSGPMRLCWTERDLWLCGMADFEPMREMGAELLYKVTKGQNYAWCVQRNMQIVSFLMVAYRAYMRAMWQDHFLAVENSGYIEVLLLGLQNEMVATLYENCHIMHDLCSHNFQRVFLSRGFSRSPAHNWSQNLHDLGFINIIPRTVWMDMMTMLSLGTQERCGENCLLRTLDDDIFFFIWTHVMRLD